MTNALSFADLGGKSLKELIDSIGLQQGDVDASELASAVMMQKVAAIVDEWKANMSSRDVLASRQRRRDV